MTEKLIEGEDFYYNDLGLMVMTRKYHLKRGYCCKNGCTHCPYDETHIKIKSNTSDERE